ncbi:hypothetical protein MCUN1_003854 [Malassezia cuniculi]|uniref:Enoyl-CoA hydratase n=1 Tax=Malassezia cuniculi TaxID=948313 RepID=A0AAF0EYA0_9BASI|nr:hypothetical protein MCUN1_003854 [Malassezia cuniculi]
MAVESKTFSSREGNIPLVRLDLNTETRIWVLTFLGEQTKDNRLTHEFILEGIIPALQHVRQQWKAWVDADDVREGTALVTTAQTDSKIYSNGLDLERAIADPDFFDQVLDKMFHEFMTLPIPSVASLGGHAFAGGFTLAMVHDYRVMNGKRGYLCMNEIEFGAPIPHGMMTALRAVVPTNTVMRKIVLQGHRFTAKEANKDGLVDLVAEGPEYEGPAGTLKKAIELATTLRSRVVKNAWGINKDVIYRELIPNLRHDAKL